MHLFSTVAGVFNHAAELLALRAIVPFLAWSHLAPWTAPPREIAEFLLLALVQVLVIACVFRPLESLMPLEPWADRQATRIDRSYTLVKLLGVTPLFTYLVLEPLSRIGGGAVDGSDEGLTSVQHWLPWLNGHPVVLFMVYLVLFDGLQYAVHRLQHAIPWWWALHSLHHSQRQLSCWSNDRDHYLDDFLEAMILAGAALLIGVAPVSYALLNLISALLENFSHANVRLRFGAVLDKLLVSPHFHRLHHMRVDPHRPDMHNCNFALVFPVWDLVGRTALYPPRTEAPRATGVGDPVVDADNTRGLLAQQLHALRRFWVAVRCKAGWLPGDVAFDAQLRPVSVRDFDLHALEAGTPLDQARKS
ncbi:MAG: fatty acid hydroxylase [Rhodoferax sp.]|nr:fatty acid hydroxylase [Rhodoferax sp.]